MKKENDLIFEGYVEQLSKSNVDELYLFFSIDQMNRVDSEIGSEDIIKEKLGFRGFEDAITNTGEHIQKFKNVEYIGSDEWTIARGSREELELFLGKLMTNSI
jgi:hypothetical protein